MRIEPWAAHNHPICCGSMQIVWSDDCGLVPVLSAMHAPRRLEQGETTQFLLWLAECVTNGGLGSECVASKSVNAYQHNTSQS